MPLQEKIQILILLSRDKDQEIRNKAFQTLRSWNGQELQQFLSDPTTALSALDFAANYLVAGHKELMEAILGNTALPDDLREAVRQASASLKASATASAASPAAGPPVSEETPEGAAKDKKNGERETLLQKISRMTPAEKIKTALTGNQEERLLLIRDSNKLVARAVLQSPKLSDAEIEAYAAMKNVSEEVLRLVSTNRAFMKSYSVVRSLLNNPRSPIDITLPLLTRLNERDLKGLSLNKNVAETLRGMAIKLIKQKQEAQKSKIPTGKH